MQGCDSHWMPWSVSIVKQISTQMNKSFVLFCIRRVFQKGKDAKKGIAECTLKMTVSHVKELCRVHKIAHSYLQLILYICRSSKIKEQQTSFFPVFFVVLFDTSEDALIQRIHQTTCQNDS